MLMDVAGATRTAVGEEVSFEMCEVFSKGLSLLLSGMAQIMRLN
ncbi:hypothetical protein Patl1_12079 [Pistacia atlantica]|uniref:Uncharacterized protein n=1 Tax=Pistacia atlantica TaxID=434234 RepID=A0ACC1A9J1_9ROSI|nr:hypothetical protein Patl1_12079 [Pistacia atlantica]